MKKIGRDHYRPSRTIIEPEGLTGREKLPECAKTCFFTNEEQRDHRVVTMIPPGQQPDAFMLWVPALSYNAEIHAPQWHDFLSQNIGIVYFAPLGQDQSDRDHPNPYITTTRPIENHASHVDQFCSKFFFPLIDKCFPNAQKILVGTSHGGAIALEYSTTYSHAFDKRALAVPMSGLPDFDDPEKSLKKERRLRTAVALRGNTIFSTEYSRNWHNERKNGNVDNPAKKWSLANPDAFSSVDITFKTVLNFLEAGRRFQDPNFYEKNPNPPIPTLILQAERDHLVSKKGLDVIGSLIPEANHILYHGMEHDGFNQKTGFAHDAFIIGNRIMETSIAFMRGDENLEPWVTLEPDIIESHRPPSGKEQSSANVMRLGVDFLRSTGNDTLTGLQERTTGLLGLLLSRRANLKPPNTSFMTAEEFLATLVHSEPEHPTPAPFST